MLKLYVVGELSGDPRNWQFTRALVIAGSEDEAIKLVGDLPVATKVAEVDMDNPILISFEEHQSRFV